MIYFFIHSSINGNIRCLLRMGSGNIKECKNLFLSNVQMSDRPVSIILLSSNRPDLHFKLSPCVECRIVFFLGNPPASELLVPTFRNLLAVRS